MGVVYTILVVSIGVVTITSLALELSYAASVITAACNAILTAVPRTDLFDTRFDSIRLMDIFVVSQAKDTCLTSLGSNL